MQSLYHNSKLREATLPWLTSLDFTHFVTLATNWDRHDVRSRNPLAGDTPELKLEKAVLAFGRWKCRILTKLCGRASHKRSDWAWGVAFPEHCDTNIHWHLLLHLSDQVSEEVLLSHAPRLWEKIVPSGDVDIRPYDKRSDLLWYVTKEFERNRDNFQLFGTCQ